MIIRLIGFRRTKGTDSLDGKHTLTRTGSGGTAMDKWSFGLTMLVVGMGGTIVTLILFSLLMGLLKKIFPYRKEEEQG
jgi:hypothetical protein